MAKATTNTRATSKEALLTATGIESLADELVNLVGEQHSLEGAPLNQGPPLAVLCDGKPNKAAPEPRHRAPRGLRT